NHVWSVAGNHLEHPPLPIQERAIHLTPRTGTSVVVEHGTFEVDDRMARRATKPGGPLVAKGVPGGELGTHWMKSSQGKLGNTWRYRFWTPGSIESQSTTRAGMVGSPSCFIASARWCPPI